MRGKSSSAGPNAVPEEDPILAQLQHDSRVTQWLSIGGVGVGLGILILLWKTLLNGYVVLFWAIACFAIGVFLGFLFGIPRVLQRGSQSDAAPPSYRLLVNTNLDDVSDWFTKIGRSADWARTRGLTAAKFSSSQKGGGPQGNGVHNS